MWRVSRTSHSLHISVNTRLHMRALFKGYHPGTTTRSMTSETRLMRYHGNGDERKMKRKSKDGNYMEEGRKIWHADTV